MANGIRGLVLLFQLLHNFVGQSTGPVWCHCSVATRCPCMVALAMKTIEKLVMATTFLFFAKACFLSASVVSQQYYLLLLVDHLHHQALDLSWWTSKPLHRPWTASTTFGSLPAFQKRLESWPTCLQSLPWSFLSTDTWIIENGLLVVVLWLFVVAALFCCPCCVALGSHRLLHDDNPTSAICLLQISHSAHVAHWVFVVLLWHMLEGSRLHEFSQLIWNYKMIIILCRVGYSQLPHLMFGSHLSLFSLLLTPKVSPK